MRSFRRSLIGIIILALIGGYYYFYEVKYRGQKAKKKELSETIFPVKSINVTKIVYQKGKMKITVVKKGNDWFLASPVQARADKKAMKSFLNTFPELKEFRKIADVKWDTPEFGLTKNPTRITLYDKKGHAYTAIFGNKNPTNSYYYTLRGKSKVVRLAWIYPANLLNKTVYDFRFKKILALPADQIDKIHFVKKDLDLVVQQQKRHTWQILSPIKAKGDRYSIEAFISSATDQKVIRFLDNPPQKPSMFGWDHPRMKIVFNWHGTLKKQKKEKTTVILVGKNRDDTHLYVKVVGSPTVMIVSTGYLKGLDKELFDFRDKNVWDYDVDDVTEVTYKNPKNHLVIVAKKNTTKGTWELLKPQKTRADTRAVENWIWDLSGFRIKKFLTKNEFTSLANGTIPAAAHLFELRVKTAKAPMTLKLYHVSDKWIVHLDDSKWYDIVDPKDVPKTFVTVFQLKYRRLLDFEDTDVQQVEIKNSTGDHLYKKKKIHWYLMEKTGKKKVANIDVLNFLWELSDLKYQKALDKLPNKDAFARAVSVTLYGKDEKSLGHLSFAPTADNKGIYFRVKGRKKIFFIDRQGTKKFEAAYHKLVNPKKKE